MNRFAAGAVCSALFLGACASSDAFTKANTSAAIAQRDADQCWQQAEKKEVPSAKANENATMAFIVAGAVGMGINYVANEDAYRGKVRDACMAKRGYSRAKSS
jgi:hypothetical protein